MVATPISRRNLEVLAKPSVVEPLLDIGRGAAGRQRTSGLLALVFCLCAHRPTCQPLPAWRRAMSASITFEFFVHSHLGSAKRPTLTAVVIPTNRLEN